MNSCVAMSKSTVTCCARGVAGRWSYVSHPAVSGDDPIFYFQRSNHARTKACIILKHQAPGEVTIRPAGLLPDHAYVVGFDSTRDVTTRTGADLMAKGITIRKQAAGELVLFGHARAPWQRLRYHPAPGARSRPCAARGHIGHGGAGVYWSPSSEDGWISFYEVRRGEKLLGKVSTGTYYFDRSPEADPSAAYRVRTINGSGLASDWSAPSNPLAGEPRTASALGGHSPESGRDGWQAATTTDGKNFTPMTFVPPVKDPAGDLGGTPNQTGRRGRLLGGMRNGARRTWMATGR